MPLTPNEQLAILSKSKFIPSFKDTLSSTPHTPLKASTIEIFQMNVGKLCNMTCKHCHVEAGPHRTEIMEKETFEACIPHIQNPKITTIDLTGGAPEMNPHLEWFIKTIHPYNKRIIVRSNLTVLNIPKYAHFLDLFAELNVEVVASVPSYNQAQTDAQRGDKTFDRSITILQELNKRGYGKSGTNNILNLVHNPVGAFLPGSQTALETEYKRQLKNQHNIEFNNLFCITNLPISRYLEYLLASDNYEDYLTELVNAFNPSSVDNVMCRNTISIGWDGQLYDCDFNQMLECNVGTQLPKTIKEFDYAKLNNRPIVTANHCYGCTAGAGSSCQGALE